VDGLERTAVDVVIAMYDDTCCQNSTNPSDHFLPQLSPNCKRAPLKDVFHPHVKGIFDQTKGFGHLLHTAYAAGIWDIVLLWEKKSEDAALNHFMKHHEDGKKIKSPEHAREELQKYAC
jgi:hypothetical protein